jgi:hypothetical protein
MSDPWFKLVLMVCIKEIIHLMTGKNLTLVICGSYGCAFLYKISIANVSLQTTLVIWPHVLDLGNLTLDLTMLDSRSSIATHKLSWPTSTIFITLGSWSLSRHVIGLDYLLGISFLVGWSGDVTPLSYTLLFWVGVYCGTSSSRSTKGTPLLNNCHLISKATCP